MALPALAQSAAPPSRTTATTPDKAPASVAKALASASNVKGAALASATTVAAGSVIVLADGIVANATITQIHAPAPCFV